ncbi:MAG: DUF3179 domain-containing protein [Gemmatimonadales bacterium]
MKYLVAALLTLGMQGQGVAQRPPGDWRTDFGRTTVPLEEIVPGGPPKDGIPPIDDPRFVSPGEASRWLNEREPVVVVALGSEARAYPLQILLFHEIVNDVVDGRPVAVTYCPLCNTALVFEREFAGQVHDFGTTGWLRYSDLVMYDRQTESWWQQATGEAIVGQHAGRKLAPVAAPLVAFREFRRSHPQGRVLSRETGHRRPYGQTPYAGYDAIDNRPFASFFRRKADTRLRAMERVVVVEHGGEALAVPFEALRTERVVHERVGGREIVVFWTPEGVSAVDARQLTAGRSVGSAAVFLPAHDNRRLTFAPSGNGDFSDDETQSTWNVLGEATAGPLKGARLDPVPHGVPFWFAWAAFRPETRVARGGARNPGP